MRQVRLLPIVVFAASALLVLKTIGIVTGGGYILGGAALAQEEGAVSASEAADAAAEAVLGTSELELAERDALGLGDLGGLDPASTEAIILQRLTERRAELDAYAEELETRLAVVEAAEIRIEERMSELAAIEARINAALDAQEAEDAARFAGLVTMYENMRPADAATIFNDLEESVLVRVGQAMNPRKLGPIMAKMEPARAQELTVLLAREEMPVPEVAPAGDPAAGLPQIVGQ